MHHTGQRKRGSTRRYLFHLLCSVASWSRKIWYLLALPCVVIVCGEKTPRQHYQSRFAAAEKRRATWWPRVLCGGGWDSSLRRPMVVGRLGKSSSSLLRELLWKARFQGLKTWWSLKSEYCKHWKHESENLGSNLRKFWNVVGLEYGTDPCLHLIKIIKKLKNKLHVIDSGVYKIKPIIQTKPSRVWSGWFGLDLNSTKSLKLRVGSVRAHGLPEPVNTLLGSA